MPGPHGHPILPYLPLSPGTRVGPVGLELQGSSRTRGQVLSRAARGTGVLNGAANFDGLNY
eukprot:765096-Hanusia_phi.AAC.6